MLDAVILLARKSGSLLEMQTIVQAKKIITYNDFNFFSVLYLHCNCMVHCNWSILQRGLRPT